MADFPALTPTNRPLTPGQWGGASLLSMSGQTSTVRRSSAEIGRRISLTFENITEAQFLQIVDHYRGQRSGLDGFSFTATTIPSSYTPSGHNWLYAGPPQVTDHHIDVFTVELECRSEPRAIFRVTGVAFTQQPALAAGGIVPLMPGLAISRTPTLAAGSLTAILSGLSISRTPTLAAGGITAIVPGASLATAPYGQGDAFFELVQLLLHGAGANNATSFTDSSSAARTITGNGNIKISTEQSKFGGSSIYCDGTGDFLSFTAISIGSGDNCTLEAWIYPTSTADRAIFGHSNNAVNMQPLSLLSDRLSLYWAGTQLDGSTVTANTWTHVAVTRSGGILRLFQNGTLTATSGSNTAAVALDRLGRGQFRGDFIGWIDDARVTVGTARYTASFTAPSSPFPDSGISNLTPGTVAPP